jgi:hypothetical protein
MLSRLSRSSRSPSAKQPQKLTSDRADNSDQFYEDVEIRPTLHRSEQKSETKRYTNVMSEQSDDVFPTMTTEHQRLVSENRSPRYSDNPLYGSTS